MNHGEECRWKSVADVDASPRSFVSSTYHRRSKSIADPSHQTRQPSLKASGRRRLLRSFLCLQYSNILIADHASTYGTQCFVFRSSGNHPGFLLEQDTSSRAAGSPELNEMFRSL